MPPHWFICVTRGIPIRYCYLTIIVYTVIFAEEIKTGFVDTAGTPYENIADHLNETKIMTGYGDNTFRPYVKITRAEFAVTALRLISMDHIAKVMKPERIYSDVDTFHWAVREIKLAGDEGIINGFEEKTFRPEGNVTDHQAV